MCDSCYTKSIYQTYKQSPSPSKSNKIMKLGSTRRFNECAQDFAGIFTSPHVLALLGQGTTTTSNISSRKILFTQKRK